MEDRVIAHNGQILATEAGVPKVPMQAGGGNVDDVQVNGESIVVDKIANLELKSRFDDTVTDEQFASAKGVFDAVKGTYVAVNVNNYNWGTVTGAGIILKDETCTLTAIPNTGCRFLAWLDANGHVISSELTYSFVPTTSVVIQAMFRAGGFVKIVDWATGSDTEIKDMLDAHYAGTIDIHDYWKVGDTRISTVNEMAARSGDIAVGETHVQQRVDWVLMDTDMVGIAPNDENINKLAFVVGMKDGLAEAGYMNPTDTNVGGWAQSARRAWCNSIFKNAIPATFRDVFKEFKMELGTGSGQTPSTIETVDTFALPPEMCIFGQNTYSKADEANKLARWAWYDVAANRVKKRGTTGSAHSWWESSPCSGRSNTFCLVASAGGADNNNASRASSLAPFGCI